MDNDNAFIEIYIKYRTSYYFDVIIDINDINLIKCYQMKNCKKGFCSKRKFKKKKKKSQNQDKIFCRSNRCKFLHFFDGGTLEECSHCIFVSVILVMSLKMIKTNILSYCNKNLNTKNGK